MKPYELLEEVKCKDSFLSFVEALMKDREESVRIEKESPSSPYGPDANGWENRSIEGFLESSLGWAEDSDFGENISNYSDMWKQFAVFLYMGKIYE